MRTSAAVHSSMQSPRSFVRHPSRPHPWGIRSLQPLNERSESLLELGRRFLDLEQSSWLVRLGRAKSKFVQLGLIVLEFVYFVWNEIDNYSTSFSTFSLLVIEVITSVRTRIDHTYETTNDPTTK